MWDHNAKLAARNYSSTADQSAFTAGYITGIYDRPMVPHPYNTNAWYAGYWEGVADRPSIVPLIAVCAVLVVILTAMWFLPSAWDTGYKTCISADRNTWEMCDHDRSTNDHP